MTNFELITKDESVLAYWLSEIGCDMCPTQKECREHGEGKSCVGVILEWLKSEANSEVDE